MSSPFKPEECPRCGVMCKVYDWRSVDIGVGMQHYDPEYECPEHGVWSLVRDEPPDDSPWALGAQRVVWRDDDCA